MLLRFGVANHRSIRDYAELLLTASRSRTRDGLTMRVEAARESVVPVVALYGANASGKSNVLDAIDDMRLIVEGSHKSADATDPLRRRPFKLDAESRVSPTRFDCTFVVGDGACDGSSADLDAVYDFGFEFTDREIQREWLHRTVRRERRSTQVLYERLTHEGEVDVKFGAHLRGENQVIARLTRANSLFLSAAAQNNHLQLQRIQEWITRRWTCILAEGPMPEPVAAFHLDDYPYLPQLSDLLRQADTGVVEVRLDDQSFDEPVLSFQQEFAEFIVDHAPEGTDTKAVVEFLEGANRRLRLMHNAGDRIESLDYDSESRGTRTFLSLLIPALQALSEGGLLIVDELDSSLHPDLAQAFVSLFLQRGANPRGAQLIFSTHDVALLGSGLLEQDEVWMTDKDVEGVTTLTPLTDYKLRGRVDIERVYRQGRVGGTPEIHGLFLRGEQS